MNVFLIKQSVNSPRVHLNQSYDQYVHSICIQMFRQKYEILQTCNERTYRVGSISLSLHTFCREQQVCYRECSSVPEQGHQLQLPTLKNQNTILKMRKLKQLYISVDKQRTLIRINIYQVLDRGVGTISLICIIL